MASGLLASLLAGCCSNALAGSLQASLANYLAARRQLSPQHRAHSPVRHAQGSRRAQTTLTQRAIVTGATAAGSLAP